MPRRSLKAFSKKLREQIAAAEAERNERAQELAVAQSKLDGLKAILAMPELRAEVDAEPRKRKAKTVPVQEGVL